MPLLVDSRRKQRATIERAYPGGLILDVTSRAEEPWVRFSPFFPHGDIPVPNSPGVFAQSVEGLWQGLKVFEREDIDPSRWTITDMRNIKRAAGSRGKVLGHRFGVGHSTLLNYRQARHSIYLPAYRWVLENRLGTQVQRLRHEANTKTVILLDYETNDDVDDLSRPLSHAALIKHFVEGRWPDSTARSQYIEAPAEYEPGSLPGVFLAGGITGCPDWQREMVALLRDLPVAILNPRRANFPIADPTAASAQIEWEFRHLRKADAILFWFPCETLCPISLYELGAWSRDRSGQKSKPLFIGVHPQYQRRADVEIQTNLVRPELRIAYALPDLAESVKRWLSSAR
jgi:hypothetical protein